MSDSVGIQHRILKLKVLRMPRTTLKTNSKFRLSRQQDSTQVALLCHGGWSVPNGYTRVPLGLVVNFYCAHGVFGTQAITIASQLFGDNDAAIDPARVMNLMQGDLSMDEAILQVKAEVNAHLDPNAMIVDRMGGQLRAKIYNYSLSYDGPRDSEQATEDVFRNHHEGNYDTDVDLMIMKDGKQSSLANAIKFALSKRSYTAFHYLPCRYVASDDTEAQKTVLPHDFGGEDFIESDLIF